MNATYFVPVFEVIDTTMESMDYHSHILTKVPDSEVLTVVFVAAKYFQNHHERAFDVLQALHDLSGPLSPSRFNRRLHALSDWLHFLAETLDQILTEGGVFVIDSPSVAAFTLAAAAKFAGGCNVDSVRPKTRNFRLALAFWLHAKGSAGALYDAASLAA